jgi:hypothetical protein
MKKTAPYHYEIIVLKVIVVMLFNIAVASLAWATVGYFMK